MPGDPTLGDPKAAKPQPWGNLPLAGSPLSNVSPDAAALGQDPSGKKPLYNAQGQQPHPAVPSQLSYQATVAQALAPLMRQLGGVGNMSQINQALGAVPQAAAANAAIPTLAQGVASSISDQVKDYTQGLNALISQSGTSEPLQELLKGMGEMLSYPSVPGAQGQSGAPSGIEQSPLLQSIYNNLNLMRNAQLPPAPTHSNSVQNLNIDSLVGAGS